MNAAKKEAEEKAALEAKIKAMESKVRGAEGEV